MALASSGSFFSSPGQKRVFSSTATSPGRRMPTVCATTGPAISGQNMTSRPSTADTAPTTMLSDCSELRAPLGRPKCASNSTFAPFAVSSLIVSTAARMRVSSVTAPSCIGRLRSTRTRATLPVMSPRSSSVRKPTILQSLSCPSPLRGRLGGGVLCQHGRSASPHSPSPPSPPRRGGEVKTRSACPSPRRYRPSGSRSPTRCHTTTARGPACLRELKSQGCRWSSCAHRG